MGKKITCHCCSKNFVMMNRAFQYSEYINLFPLLEFKTRRITRFKINVSLQL